MPILLMSRIYERVREKKESYRRYNFEHLQEEAFATFFDLAQEYTTIDYLYQICVAVPKEFFGLESQLYVIDPKTSRLERVCSSEAGIIPVEERAPCDLRLAESIYETEAAWVFPIRGNQALTKWIPFLDQRQILGLFEIRPKERVDDKGHFFLEKFTNRIGYNLHQKLLIQHNVNHIKFINQLVSDIEHNVITPNMYYKLFLLRLKKAISEYKRIQGSFRILTLLHSRRQRSSCQRNCMKSAHALSRNSDNLDQEADGFVKALRTYQSLSRDPAAARPFLEGYVCLEKTAL